MKPFVSRRLWPFVLVTVVACGGTSAGESTSDSPSNLNAGPLGGGVHLTWQDNSDNEDLFEIERKEAASAFQLLDTTPFNTALYHDSNVTLGTTYTYRIRAKLPSGFSAYSNEASTTAVAPNSTATAGAAGATSGASGNGSGGQTTGGGNGGSSNSNGGTTGNGGTATGGAATGGTATGGAVTGGAGGAITSNGGAGGTPVVSFQTDIAPILAQSCGSTTSGCHNADQAVGRIMPQFGPCKVIWFSAVDELVGATYISGPNMGQPTGCADLSLYDRLTTLHSMLCEAPSWDQRPQYVVPGDLDKSLLYQVVAGDPSMGGTCANMGVPVRTMPLVDPMILPVSVALGSEGVAKIRDWILQGAQNN